MISATDHSELVTVASSSSFGCVAENAQTLTLNPTLSSRKKEKTDVDSHLNSAKLYFYSQEFSLIFVQERILSEELDFIGGLKTSLETIIAKPFPLRSCRIVRLVV